MSTLSKPETSAIASRFEKGRDLVQIGAYVPGTDPTLDQAIHLHAPMASFLQQDMYVSASLSQSVDEMSAAILPSAG